MTDTPTLPRGVRNHNPGNIKAIAGMKWRGQIGQDKDGFCIFSEPRWGLRAVAVIWQDYCYFHGFTSLYQYVHRWAPDVPQGDSDYIRVLCAAAQVGPTEPYNPCDRPLQVLRAIVCMECGHCPYPNAVLQQAIDQAHIR